MGSASMQKHYEKLLRDYDILPDDLKAEVDRMRGDYAYRDFQPKYCVHLVWQTYWAVKATKAFDNPVNHTDIYHYTKLMRLVLEVWEVRALLSFDRAYYASHSKYHKE